MKDNRAIIAKLRTDSDLIARLEEGFKTGNLAVLRELWEFCKDEIAEIYDDAVKFQLSFIVLLNFAKKAENQHFFTENFEETIFDLVGAYHENELYLNTLSTKFARSNKTELFYIFSCHTKELLDATYGDPAIFAEKKKAFLDNFKDDAQRKAVSDLIYCLFNKDNNSESSKHLLQNIIEKENLAEVFYHCLMALDIVIFKKAIDQEGDFDFFCKDFCQDLVSRLPDKHFSRKIVRKLNVISEGEFALSFKWKSELADVYPPKTPLLSYEELKNYFSECEVSEDDDYVAINQSSVSGDRGKIKDLILLKEVEVQQNAEGCYNLRIAKNLFNRKIFLCHNIFLNKPEIINEEFLHKQYSSYVKFFRLIMPFATLPNVTIMSGLLKNYVIEEDIKVNILKNLEKREKQKEEARLRKEEATNKLYSFFQDKSYLSLIEGFSKEMSIAQNGINSIDIGKKGNPLILTITKRDAKKDRKELRSFEFKKISGVENKVIANKQKVTLEMTITDPDLFLSAGLDDLQKYLNPSLVAEEVIKKDDEEVKDKKTKKRPKKKKAAADVAAVEDVAIIGAEEKKEISQNYYEDIAIEETIAESAALKADIMIAGEEIERHRWHNEDARVRMPQFDLRVKIDDEGNIFFLENFIGRIRKEKLLPAPDFSEILQNFAAQKIEIEEKIAQAMSAEDSDLAVVEAKIAKYRLEIERINLEISKCELEIDEFNIAQEIFLRHFIDDANIWKKYFERLELRVGRRYNDLSFEFSEYQELCNASLRDVGAIEKYYTIAQNEREYYLQLREQISHDLKGRNSKKISTLASKLNIAIENALAIQDRTQDLVMSHRDMRSEMLYYKREIEDFNFSLRILQGGTVEGEAQEIDNIKKAIEDLWRYKRCIRDIKGNFKNTKILAKLKYDEILAKRNEIETSGARAQNDVKELLTQFYAALKEQLFVTQKEIDESRLRLELEGRELSEAQLLKSKAYESYEKLLDGLRESAIFNQDAIRRAIKGAKEIIAIELDNSVLKCGAEVDELQAWREAVLKLEKILNKFDEIGKELIEAKLEKEIEFAQYQKYQSKCNVEFDEKLQDLLRQQNQQQNQLDELKKLRDELVQSAAEEDMAEFLRNELKIAEQEKIIIDLDIEIKQLQTKICLAAKEILKSSLQDFDYLFKLQDAHKEVMQKLQIASDEQTVKKQKYLETKKQAQESKQAVEEAVDYMCHEVSIKGGGS